MRCAAKKHVSELRKEWTGLKVCGDCWEPRHPQDKVRAVPDPQRVPNASPEPADVFVAPTAQTASTL